MKSPIEESVIFLLETKERHLDGAVRERAKKLLSKVHEQLDPKPVVVPPVVAKPVLIPPPVKPATPVTTPLTSPVVVTPKPEMTVEPSL